MNAVEVNTSHLAAVPVDDQPAAAYPGTTYVINGVHAGSL